MAGGAAVRVDLIPSGSVFSRPEGGQKRRGIGICGSISSGLEPLDRAVGHQPLQPAISLILLNVKRSGDIHHGSGLVHVAQQQCSHAGEQFLRRFGTAAEN